MDSAPRSSLARRLAITAVPVVLVVPLMAGLAHPASPRAAGPAAPNGPTIDWALSGQASATSSESGYPASNAIDGDAGIDWCTSSWTGSLVVDLGQVRSLSDLGLTLDAASPSADATIEVASQPGGWRSVPDAQNVALDPGNPMYVPLPRGTQARYAQLTVYSDTGADVCVGEFRMFGPDPAAAGLDLGADLSFTPQELAAGARFTDRGREASPVTIMRDNGAGYVRMRLWVDPPPGYSDLASDLALARAVHAAGMKIYLDIMYSDFWADPTKQNIPAAWQGEDLAQLTATVQSYTQQVISAFADQGTPVDLVSIGNEIRNGILWPAGEVDPATGAGFDALATLLKAGVAGARAGNPPGHRLLIMMHYDQGGNNQLSQAFFQNLVSRGVPFDVIGLSYYPFFHGPISPCARTWTPSPPSSTSRSSSRRPSTRGRWRTATARSATARATSSGRPASCRPAIRRAPAASCPLSATSCRSWPRCPTGSGPGCSTGHRTGSPASGGSRAPAWGRRTSTSRCSTSRARRSRRSASSGTRPPCAKATTRPRSRA